jgi:hypothetical protein
MTQTEGECDTRGRFGRLLPKVIEGGIIDLVESSVGYPSSLPAGRLR